MTIDPTHPNAFFGTEDPADEELAYLDEIYRPEPVRPAPAGPRIVPPGEDASTMIIDHTPSVRDVRTPPAWLPFQAILADRFLVTMDRLRLVQGEQTERGAVTLWEMLEPDLRTVSGFYVASYVGGQDRPHVAFRRQREEAMRSYETRCLDHGSIPARKP